MFNAGIHFNGDEKSMAENILCAPNISAVERIEQIMLELQGSDPSEIIEVLCKELIKTMKRSCQLSNIIYNSYDGIYVTDQSGNTLGINRAYSKLAGVSYEEIEETNCVNLEGVVTSKTITPFALQEKQTVTMDQTLLKTGRRVLVTANPIFNEDGSAVDLVVLNVRDITELELLKRRLDINAQIVRNYADRLDIMREQLLGKSNLVAVDMRMLTCLKTAKQVAVTASSVLLQGETGVGKEVFAKFIHENSRRSSDAFIKVNCAAIPENLIESELFGYESGSFTGAKSKGKMGLFEAANHGTIFLDEIGELPPNMQVKLLRVLQEGEIQRIGALKPQKVDVRVIAATNRNLEDMIKEGSFRSDLYYRLNVISIRVPALRERRDDILPLTQYFLDFLNTKYAMHKSLSPETQQILVNYNWPGNVRELQNVIERAVILSLKDELIPTDFPISDDIMYEYKAEVVIPDCGLDIEKMLSNIEYSYLKKAYETYGNIRDAARALGLKKSTFAKKMKTYSENSK